MFLLLILILLMSGCSLFGKKAEPTATPTPEATETPTPEPTPTMPPSAAVVNGIPVTLEDLDAKTAQLRDAYSDLGEDVPGDDALREEALNDLIEETLFLSAARRSGTALSNEALDGKVESLCASAGGCDKLREWESRNHYNEESFRRALERESAVSIMREVILEGLKDMEQLHVYRIQSSRRADLDDVNSRLGMGISFSEMAKNYDAVTGGDMNWFPRGVLFSEDIENKIFALNPGEHTEIIEINGSYNMFYVAEKQTGRAMDMQVEQIAQKKAIADWLEKERNSAEIIFL